MLLQIPNSPQTGPRGINGEETKPQNGELYEIIYKEAKKLGQFKDDITNR